MSLKSLFSGIARSHKSLGLLAGPLIFLAIKFLFHPSILEVRAWTVIGVGIWMVIWWVTEAVPIPVTALLPLILFPSTGVFNIREAAAPYSNPIVFLFLGGFIIALAMEKRHLHTRIALNLIRITGTDTNGIILGFMVATAFISMWISNTATAVMMLPIAISVVKLLRANAGDISGRREEGFRLFSLCLMLGIAYSANIGGVATIIGTPPNAVLVGLLSQSLGYELDFSKWLLVGIPVSVVMLASTYLVLVKWLYPNRLGNIPGSDKYFRSELKKLGRIKRPEAMVLGIFALTALTWILRQPINSLLKTNLDDTVIAMTGGLLLFILPVNLREREFILKWEDMERLPWGILLLFGGGLSLAGGLEATGIIQLLGTSLAEYGSFSTWSLVVILSGIMLFMTELMSNVALASVFLPVVIGIAQGFNIDPVLLCVPVTIASSFAFMMPVATPPNAIVFASGYIKSREMFKSGLVLNLISLLVLLLFSQTLFQWLF